jgi:hypothetical protein
LVIASLNAASDDFRAEREDSSPMYSVVSVKAPPTMPTRMFRTPFSSSKLPPSLLCQILA